MSRSLVHGLNLCVFRSLSKLVNLNNPDLVLFVGEALVGNDSIDQVTQLQKALQEKDFSYAPPD